MWNHLALSLCSLVRAWISVNIWDCCVKQCFGAPLKELSFLTFLSNSLYPLPHLPLPSIPLLFTHTTNMLKISLPSTLPHTKPFTSLPTPNFPTWGHFFNAIIYCSFMSSYIPYHSNGNETKGWLACNGATDFSSLSDEFLNLQLTQFPVFIYTNWRMRRWLFNSQTRGLSARWCFVSTGHVALLRSCMYK